MKAKNGLYADTLADLCARLERLRGAAEGFMLELEAATDGMGKIIAAMETEDAERPSLHESGDAPLFNKESHWDSSLGKWVEGRQPNPFAPGDCQGGAG